MAGIRYYTEVSGTEDVLVLFNRFIGLGGDASAPLKDVGEYYLRRTEERGKLQQVPGGDKWTPLATSTRA